MTPLTVLAENVEVGDLLSWAGRWVRVVDHKPVPDHWRSGRNIASNGRHLIVQIEPDDEPRQLHYWNAEIVLIQRAAGDTEGDPE